MASLRLFQTSLSYGHRAPFIADESLIALAKIALIMPRWLGDPGASLGGAGRRGIIRDSALWVTSCASVA
jgi:hypothetical protein